MQFNLPRIIRLVLLVVSFIVIYKLIEILYRYHQFTKNGILIVDNYSQDSFPPSPRPILDEQSNIIPVAVVLSLAQQTSHIAEFHLLYASWRFIQNFPPLSEQVIVDLIVFCEQPSCYQLPSSCIPLSYKKTADSTPKCFYEELSRHIVIEWQSYLYMTSIAFMLTKEYKKAIVNYQWVLRVDQDALLTPGLLFGIKEKHPKKLYNMQFGAVGHGIDFTHQRLRQIAKKLGYKHSSIHNLCSTWLVRPQDSITIANLTTRIGKHFLQNEYGPHVPGIENLPAIGEWPKWWRGVTSLYAADIAINHIYSSTLGHQHESNALDHPSYSHESLWNAWHIHCLHNEEGFSKFKHRNELKVFLGNPKPNRIEKMRNGSITQTVLNSILNEFQTIQTNNGKITGKIAVRDYVTALAWQKSYSAIGAINLD